MDMALNVQNSAHAGYPQNAGGRSGVRCGLPRRIREGIVKNGASLVVALDFLGRSSVRYGVLRSVRDRPVQIGACLGIALHLVKRRTVGRSAATYPRGFFLSKSKAALALPSN
jgi:hypothetical protein